MEKLKTNYMSFLLFLNFKISSFNFKIFIFIFEKSPKSKNISDIKIKI